MKFTTGDVATVTFNATEAKMMETVINSAIEMVLEFKEQGDWTEEDQRGLSELTAVRDAFAQLFQEEVRPTKGN